MSKHTPGKWELQDFYIVSLNSGSWGNKTYICEVMEGSLDERKANAELIARSPELLEENDRLKELNKAMLEALELALPVLGFKASRWAGDASVYDKVKKAIKKANGETP